MTKNTDSYAFARTQEFEQNAEHLSGCPNGYVLIVSTQTVAPEGKDALQKSFAALGYGRAACSYLVATSSLLQPDRLFCCIEAIDPGVVVSVDGDAISLLEQAYHQNMTGMGPSLHLFGRSLVALNDFSALMQTESGHQKIWAALKTLPRLSS